jgi:hypothetical protein
MYNRIYEPKIFRVKQATGPYIGKALAPSLPTCNQMLATAGFQCLNNTKIILLWL